MKTNGSRSAGPSPPREGGRRTPCPRRGGSSPQGQRDAKKHRRCGRKGYARRRRSPGRKRASISISARRETNDSRPHNRPGRREVARRGSALDLLLTPRGRISSAGIGIRTIKKIGGARAVEDRFSMSLLRLFLEGGPQDPAAPCVLPGGPAALIVAWINGRPPVP